jgi:hypothetical protein
MNAIYVGVGLVLVFYVGAPLLILATFKINARPEFEPVPVENMPAEVYDYFGQTAGMLQRLGFELISYFTMPGSVANVVPYCAFWQNRATAQASLVTVIYAAASTPKQSIEFSTKWADGFAVMTNNSASQGTFKRTHHSDTLYASSVQNMAQLYRLHCYRESLLTKPGAVRFLPARGEELKIFAISYEYVTRRQIATGYLREDSTPGVYRATFKGAFGMTWPLLPPFKQQRASAEKKRLDEQLAAAMDNPLAPPTNIRISHESPYHDDPAAETIAS